MAERVVLSVIEMENFEPPKKDTHAVILTFFILAAAISHGGLYFIGHIPTHTIMLKLFGNNSLLGIFD